MTDTLYQNVASDRARFLREARKLGPFAAMSTAQFLNSYHAGGFVAEHDDGLWVIDLQECEVIPIGKRIPHGARQTLQQGFQISINQQFATVMNECARPRPNSAFRDKWLKPKLAAGLLDLHRQGHAHSFEAWRNGRLVGGGFGVQTGGLYISLSLFKREDEAGKAVFIALDTELNRLGFDLHLGSLPSNISRCFGGRPQRRQDIAPLLAKTAKRNLAIQPRPAILLAASPS